MMLKCGAPLFINFQQEIINDAHIQFRVYNLLLHYAFPDKEQHCKTSNNAVNTPDAEAIFF